MALVEGEGNKKDWKPKQARSINFASNSQYSLRVMEILNIYNIHIFAGPANVVLPLLRDIKK